MQALAGPGHFYGPHPYYLAGRGSAQLGQESGAGKLDLFVSAHREFRRAIGSRGWFSGNHWWFRSRVLAGGTRFKDIWLTEPAFQLDLGEQGYRGMASKDAVAGHRIQPALFDRKAALKRAKKTGAEAAIVSLCPFRKSAKQARLLSEHPGWAVCTALPTICAGVPR